MWRRWVKSAINCFKPIVSKIASAINYIEPIVLPCVAMVKAVCGDKEGAKKAFGQTLSCYSSLLNQIPVVGHVKSAFHYYVQGDKKAAADAFKASTHTLGAFAGGTIGFALGGPAGAQWGRVAVGAFADAGLAIATGDKKGAVDAIKASLPTCGSVVERFIKYAKGDSAGAWLGGKAAQVLTDTSIAVYKGDNEGAADIIKEASHTFGVTAGASIGHALGNTAGARIGSVAGGFLTDTSISSYSDSPYGYISDLNDIRDGKINGNIIHRVTDDVEQGLEMVEKFKTNPKKGDQSDVDKESDHAQKDSPERSRRCKVNPEIEDCEKCYP